MTMMIRDEEVNLKSNLALWATVVSYFVILVDERTIDQSAHKAREILEKANRPHVIVNYTFTGFGEARTLSLNYAWKHFSNATHVLIADPDWRPDISTINISELDESADVFRFIVFDRNGISRRRIDWLLLHKPNLKMRYSLHEVLDIGLYQVKSINWIVHEIEQLGTWHATVGHGHSHGITRYEFDLALLLRDLKLYSNDPHVDYYLGITFYAYAEAVFSQSGFLNESSIERSVYFLQRRLFSTYTDEFVEERWAAMYTLGGIFASLRRDYVLAIKWFSLCRDYNPKQVECSTQLTKVFLQINRFDLAQAELEQLLKQDLQERLMLNMLHTSTCGVPLLVMDINSIRYANNLLSSGDAWFQLLMMSVYSKNRCTGSEASFDHGIEVVTAVLQVDPKPYLNQLSNLCGVKELQLYLIAKDIKLHPCEDFRNRLFTERICSSFLFPIPPPSEELQLNSEFRQFVGAASLPDIIHHVYAGDESRILARSAENPLRFLFAEFFERKLLFSLIGSLLRHEIQHFQIHVISQDFQLYSSILEEIRLCSPLISLPDLSNRLFIEHISLEKFFEAEDLAKFDYIEYNGGVSLTNDYRRHLEIFKKLLSPEGVIGLTFFSRNKHVLKLKELISRANHSNLVPFSIEAKNIIRNYFDLHNLKAFHNDRELLWMLGAEPVERIIPPKRIDELMPAKSCIWFSRVEVRNIMSDAGLHIAAWIPTGYTNPYDELNEEYNIFKHFISGMTEEAFIDEYLPSFRYTIYVSQVKSSSIARFRLNMTHLQDKLLAAAISMEDRIGNLGSTFLRLQNISTTSIFRINPLYSNHAFSFERSISPHASTSLSLLQGKCRLLHVITKAKDTSAPNFDSAEVLREILLLLKLLEATNSIVFSFDRTVVAFLQHLEKYFVSKNLSEARILILHNCANSLPLTSFRGLSTSILCKSQHNLLQNEAGVKFISSLSEVSGTFDYIIVSNPLPQADLKIIPRLIHAGTVLAVHSDEAIKTQNALLDLHQIILRPAFTEIQNSWITPFLVVNIEKDIEAESVRPERDDPQFQHLKYLGFDESFLKNFQQEAPLLTAQNLYPKIKELEETRSSLQHLLSALKEKNLNISNEPKLEEISMVEEDSHALHLLSNHSFVAQGIPLTSKILSLPLSYRRNECWR